MVKQLPYVELQYLDGSGSKGATRMFLPLDTTVADGEASAIALASLLAPITGCTLIRSLIRYRAVAEARVEAFIGSSITNSGVFIFEDETGESQTLVAVPGLLSSKLVLDGPGSGVLIDIDDSDVIAFLDAFAASGMTNPFAELCINIIAAYRQSRL